MSNEGGHQISGGSIGSAQGSRTVKLLVVCGVLLAVAMVGGPEMLRYGEAPDPAAGPGEVVVDIHAASVNAADYKVRLGSGRSALKFPYILGRDFSGVVSAVGPGVTDLAVGDAVFGVLDQGIEGAYAEKVAIKAAIIAKKPDRLGHAEGDQVLAMVVAPAASRRRHRLPRGGRLPDEA